MDKYHKMPAHHGLRDLLGDKMEEETARIKCKTCQRDGMPPDEEECKTCFETRQLYHIREEVAEWHNDKYEGERLDRFEFDDEVFDKWPYLKDRSVDGMWYLDHTIKRNLDRILRHRMSDYQESKGVPYWKRSNTKIWKNSTSRRKGEVVSRKSPLVSACCFDVGTRMKGNDGWTYTVRLRKDGTNFWSKRKAEVLRMMRILGMKE